MQFAQLQQQREKSVGGSWPGPDSSSLAAGVPVFPAVAPESWVHCLSLAAAVRGMWLCVALLQQQGAVCVVQLCHSALASRDGMLLQWVVGRGWKGKGRASVGLVLVLFLVRSHPLYMYAWSGPLFVCCCEEGSAWPGCVEGSCLIDCLVLARRLGLSGCCTVRVPLCGIVMAVGPARTACATC
jgi:hypothetical protein